MDSGPDAMIVTGFIIQLLAVAAAILERLAPAFGGATRVVAVGEALRRKFRIGTWDSVVLRQLAVPGFEVPPDPENGERGRWPAVAQIRRRGKEWILLPEGRALGADFDIPGVVAGPHSHLELVWNAPSARWEWVRWSVLESRAPEALKNGLLFLAIAAGLAVGSVLGYVLLRGWALYVWAPFGWMFLVIGGVMAVALATALPMHFLGRALTWSGNNPRIALAGLTAAFGLGLVLQLVAEFN